MNSKISVLLFFIIALFCFVPKAKAATTIASDITSDTTWSASGNPYIISKSVQVPAGVTLTVSPGTIVKFAKGTSIAVSGSVISVGSSDGTIYFTSLVDDTLGGDTNGDGTKTLPKMDDYGGFVFTAGSTGTFQNIEMRYATAGISETKAALSVANSAFTTDDSAIISSYGTLGLSGNAFSSGKIPIQASCDTVFTHTGDTFTGNTYNGIDLTSYLSGPLTFQAGDAPYFLFSEIKLVGASAPLTFEPGVVVESGTGRPDDTLIQTQGDTVTAFGTDEKRIDLSRIGLDLTSATQATFVDADMGNFVLSGSSAAATNATFRGLQIVSSTFTAHDTVFDNTITYPNGAQNGFSESNSTVDIEDSTFRNAVEAGSSSFTADDVRSVVTINNTTFESVYNCITMTRGATLTADHLTLKKCPNIAIDLLLDLNNGPFYFDKLTLRDSEIANATYGLWVQDQMTVDIQNSSFHDNTFGAYTDQNSNSYGLTNNWWGDPSGPTNASTNPGGKGDRASDKMIITPWLTVDPFASVSEITDSTNTSSATNDADSDSDSSSGSDSGTDTGSNTSDTTQSTDQDSTQNSDQSQTSSNDNSTSDSNATDSDSTNNNTQENVITLSTAPRRTPVLIIPGILGSYLNKDYGDKSEIWPSIDQLVLSPSDDFLNTLSLTTSGEEDPAFPMSVGDIVRNIDGTNIFAGLMSKLETGGYAEGTDLFVFPYDWRMSDTDTAVLLKQKIDQILAQTGSSKVDIVAHSMGGLVAKKYIADNGSGFVDKLILIGTPNLGAPQAFKALMYGDDMNMTKYGLGLSADRVKTISQNMPSVYDLLPSRQYVGDTFPGDSYVFDAVDPNLSGSTGPLLDYDQTTNFMIEQGRNASLFPEAESLHSSTDSLDLSGLPVYNFVGCGLTKTIGGIIAKTRESQDSNGTKLSDDFQILYVDGDQTVPAYSAVGAYGTNYYVKGDTHAELPSSPGVPDSILAILSGTSLSSSDVTTDDNTCDVSGSVISTHGIVAMNIYDAQGDHVGPKADGTIESNIPGVEYDQIGEDTFAFLPDGVQYTVVNTPTDTGTYDAYVQKVAGNDVVTDEQYFNAIPVLNFDAQSKFVVDGSSNSPISIAVDQNGDGTFETDYSPSATLDQTKAADHVPPKTTVYVSEDGTVTLTATDDNAGVLKTQYSLDGGSTWETYASPFSGSGLTIEYFSVDNAGNTESLQSLSVPAVSIMSSSAVNNDTTSTNSAPPVIGKIITIPQVLIPMTAAPIPAVVSQDSIPVTNGIKAKPLPLLTKKPQIGVVHKSQTKQISTPVVSTSVKKDTENQIAAVAVSSSFHPERFAILFALIFLISLALFARDRYKS